MEGRIVGGWEFVYAAYAVTALILLGYAASVVSRYRRARRHHHQRKDQGVPPS